MNGHFTGLQDECFSPGHDELLQLLEDEFVGDAALGPLLSKLLYLCFDVFAHLILDHLLNLRRTVNQFVWASVPTPTSVALTLTGVTPIFPPRVNTLSRFGEGLERLLDLGIEEFIGQ